MAKLTVTKIKKQIVMLEAKAARLAHAETAASVSKVRALMNQLGVTLEHLSSTVARKGATIKKSIVGAKPAPAKRAGKGIAKYRDPATGAIWSGFGRAPGWIAGAANRDVFLVDSSSSPKASSKPVPVAKKAKAKRAVTKKVVAKKASAKRATSALTKRSGAPTKKAAPVVPKNKTAANATRKPGAKKAATKRAVSDNVAAAPASAGAAVDSAT